MQDSRIGNQRSLRGNAKLAEGSEGIADCHVTFVTSCHAAIVIKEDVEELHLQDPISSKASVKTHQDSVKHVKGPVEDVPTDQTCLSVVCHENSRTNDQTKDKGIKL